MNLNLIVKYSIILLLVLISVDLMAQCPMCSMSASANLKDGGTAGKGLNIGIMFMLSMPYILVGSLIYILFKKFGGNQESIDTTQDED